MANSSIFLQAQIFPHDSADLLENGGGNEQMVLSPRGLVNNLEDRPLRIEKGGDIDVRIYNGPKKRPVACGIHR
jgi:hypothetical protein